MLLWWFYFYFYPLLGDKGDPGIYYHLPLCDKISFFLALFLHWVCSPLWVQALLSLHTNVLLFLVTGSLSPQHTLLTRIQFSVTKGFQMVSAKCQPWSLLTVWFPTCSSLPVSSNVCYFPVSLFMHWNKFFICSCFVSRILLLFSYKMFLQASCQK